MLLQTISVFRYTLPVKLKIYSSRYIYYRFSVLTEYIGTRPSFEFFSLPSCENSHDQHCKKPTIANRLNVTRKIATSGDAATVVCRLVSVAIVNATYLATLLHRSSNYATLPFCNLGAPWSAGSLARITSFNKAGCAAGRIKIAGDLIG